MEMKEEYRNVYTVTGIQKGEQIIQPAFVGQPVLKTEKPALRPKSFIVVIKEQKPFYKKSQQLQRDPLYTME